MLGLCLTALVTAAAPSDLGSGAAPWRLVGVPLLSYGEDVGWQGGAAVFVYKPAREGERGDYLALAGIYASRGPRFAELRGEKMRLEGTSVRVAGQLKLVDDDVAPYWGEGAELGAYEIPAGPGTPPEPYRWRHFGQWASLIVRGKFLGALGWLGRLRWSRTEVVGRGPLLSAEQPRGADGGRVGWVYGGLFVDTRDREVATSSGVFADASLSVSPSLAGVSDYAMLGFNVTARGYLPLWSGGVLATRAMWDHKQGEVPFFERLYFEGLTYAEGLGGAFTLRGVARNRISGNDKMLAAGELRTTVATLHLFDRLQELGLGAGLEWGLARDPGRASVQALCVVGGARLYWDRAVLLRIEGGFANQGGVALYVSFDETF